MYCMKLSDYIFSYLSEYGIKDIFMISGGGNMHLINSVGTNGKLNYICNHHEQASAMAAEAYSRVKNDLAVCLVTTGPGATNTITGLLGAWLDSIPVLFISGQVKRDTMITNTNLRQFGVQEADIINIVDPITKYSVVVNEPKTIRYHLEKAIHIATHGRKGPVWLDIPLDVQASEIDHITLDVYEGVKDINNIINNKLNNQVKEVISLIKKSERPVFFAGHGIRLSDSHKLFLDVVERLGVPVVTSMSGTDVIDSDHKLFIGRPGTFGNRSGNFGVQNSDLVISLGARLHLWNIGYDYKNFAREAIKVVVDIDEAELNKKTITPDYPVLADVKDFLKLLNEQIKDENNLPDFSIWQSMCQKWKTNYPVVLSEYKNDKDYVNSYYFIDILSDIMSDDEIIFTGNGSAFTGTIQSIKIRGRQRFHCNVGCASMGYDLPAAIGACVANDKKRIVLITGDGSIMMNLQELQTIYHHKLPIKIFLLNNNGYLAIKNTQRSFFDNNFVAAESKSGVSFPDFKEVSNAFKINYVRMQNSDSVKEKIEEVLDSDGPVLCDINMNPDQDLFPKVRAEQKEDGTLVSKPIEDMYPFLDRDEFKNNMIIKPINF